MDMAVQGLSISIEEQLNRSGTNLLNTAKSILVTDQASLEMATNWTKEVKTQISRVTDYWKEPKQSADKLHKDMVAREKAMLKPYQEAETIVKNTISKYLAEERERQRKAAEELKRQKEEEAQRLLDAAIEAERQGNNEAATMNMMMAEAVSDMPVTPVETPKASGLSERKTWKARVDCDDDVPAYYKGMEIRSINMSVLNTIARMTKGTAKIPGVVFFEESSTVIRR